MRRIATLAAILAVLMLAVPAGGSAASWNCNPCWL